MPVLRLFGVNIVIMPVLRLFGLNIVVGDHKSDGGDQKACSDSTVLEAAKVYNPVPLRWFRPEITINLQSGSNHDLVDTRLKSDSSASTIDDHGHQEIQRKERKRKYNAHRDVIGGGRKKKKRAAEEDLGPEPSVEEIFPGLVERIRESGDGSTSPKLLYRKVLQDSDVEKQQNRLLICQKAQPNFTNFFTPEEAAAVDHTKQGAEVGVILPQRQGSSTLRLRRWNNSKIMVLNSGWSNLVSECNAEMEDVVHIWGFRENGKLGLAINFVNNHKPAVPTNGEGTSKVE